MQAQKIVKENIDLEITGVTLLTTEEARALSKDVLCAPCDWWLRSPGDGDNFAASVDGGIGHVDAFGNHVPREFGVRPALKFNPESSKLDVGDKFLLFGYAWTVIAKNKALCDEIIGESSFRSDWPSGMANKYEMSDIKKYLDKWFKKVTSDIS